jgi:hypothetical protein
LKEKRRKRKEERRLLKVKYFHYAAWDNEMIPVLWYKDILISRK